MTPVPGAFESEVIDRLARIESKQESQHEEYERRFKVLEEHDARNLLIAAGLSALAAVVVRLG